MKGGQIKALKELTWWIIALSIVVVLSGFKILDIKKNYYKLHFKVNDIDLRLRTLEGWKDDTESHEKKNSLQNIKVSDVWEEIHSLRTL
jgi:hypothetical protein